MNCSIPNGCRSFRSWAALSWPLEQGGRSGWSGAVPHVRNVWGPAALHGSLDVTGITGAAEVLEHSRTNENLKTQRVLSLQKYLCFGRGEEEKGKNKLYTKRQNRLRLSLLVTNQFIFPCY